jgi:hypothetical protein
MVSPALVLITHFAAEIKLIEFLNQGRGKRLWDLNVTSPQM